MRPLHARRLAALATGLAAALLVGGCGASSAPEASDIAPTVSDGMVEVEEGYDPDEQFWFSQRPDPSILDYSDAVDTLTLDDLEAEPAPAADETWVDLPELPAVDGPDVGAALDVDGPGQWMPTRLVCDMLPIQSWQEWSGDPDAFAVTVSEDECAYYTTADLHRMEVTAELGGPLYFGAGDEWQRGTVLDTIPSHWRTGSPKPFAAQLFASVEAIAVFVTVYSRDTARSWDEVRVYQEEVAAEVWGGLFW